MRGLTKFLRLLGIALIGGAMLGTTSAAESISARLGYSTRYAMRLHRFG